MVLNRFNDLKSTKSTFNGLQFLFIFSLILTVAEFCEHGQFQAGRLFGCVDCPKEPGKYCRNEGEYAENCKTSCIAEAKGKQANIEIKHIIYIIMIMYIVYEHSMKYLLQY